MRAAVPLVPNLRLSKPGGCANKRTFMKNSQYWIEMQLLADEIRRLSTEVQGPLIEEHIDHLEANDMDVGEITKYIEQFYTDEDAEAWLELEVRGIRIAEEYQVDPKEMSTDMFMLVAEESTAEQSSRH